jgi:hypothetical protein
MSSQIEDDAEKENLNQSQGDAMKTTIISVGCQNMNGSTQNVQIVIGHPNPENHPIQFQVKSLGDKGLTVPSNIMDSLGKLYKLSSENNAEFVDLVEYALKIHQKKQEEEKVSQDKSGES